MYFIWLKKTSLNKKEQTPKESDTQLYQKAAYWKLQNFIFTSFRSAMAFRNHTAKRRSSAFFFFPFSFCSVLFYKKGGKPTRKGES
jgi:predicted NodU family carbamoyl transferase